MTVDDNLDIDELVVEQSDQELEGIKDRKCRVLTGKCRVFIIFSCAESLLYYGSNMSRGHNHGSSGDASAFCSRVKCFRTRACRYSKTHYCTFDNCRFIYPLFEVDEPLRLFELT